MADSYRKSDNKIMYERFIKERLCSVLYNLAEYVSEYREKIIKGASAVGILGIGILLFILVIRIHQHVTYNNLANSDFVQMENMITATSTKTATISVPAGIKKANPFLPYRNLDPSKNLNDIPDFTLVEPPETIDENSDAARVMDTIVSGILYDRFSPSAILNIEGSDYLVKKGDVVNNYKVLNISQNSVTVQLGHNTYKAGIGEILTEGTLNKNEVSNLNRKFGGKK